MRNEKYEKGNGKKDFYPRQKKKEHFTSNSLSNRFQHPNHNPKTQKIIQLNIAFAKMGKNQQIHKAIQIYLDKKKNDADFEPTAVTFNVLISACVRCGDLKNANFFFQEFLQAGKKNSRLKPDVITFTALLKGYCVWGWTGHAANLLDFMTSPPYEISPNVRTVAMFLRGCLWTGDLLRTFNILSRLSSWWCELDTVCVEYVVRIFCMSLRILDAEKVLGEFVDQILKRQETDYSRERGMENRRREQSQGVDRGVSPNTFLALANARASLRSWRLAYRDANTTCKAAVAAYESANSLLLLHHKLNSAAEVAPSANNANGAKEGRGRKRRMDEFEKPVSKKSSQLSVLEFMVKKNENLMKVSRNLMSFILDAAEGDETANPKGVSRQILERAWDCIHPLWCLLGGDGTVGQDEEGNECEAAIIRAMKENRQIVAQETALIDMEEVETQKQKNRTVKQFAVSSADQTQTIQLDTVNVTGANPAARKLHMIFDDEDDEEDAPTDRKKVAISDSEEEEKGGEREEKREEEGKKEEVEVSKREVEFSSYLKQILMLNVGGRKETRQDSTRDKETFDKILMSRLETYGLSETLRKETGKSEKAYKTKFDEFHKHVSGIFDAKSRRVRMEKLFYGVSPVSSPIYLQINSDSSQWLVDRAMSERTHKYIVVDQHHDRCHHLLMQCLYANVRENVAIARALPYEFLTEFLPENILSGAFLFFPDKYAGNDLKFTSEGEEGEGEEGEEGEEESDEEPEERGEEKGEEKGEETPSLVSRLFFEAIFKILMRKKNFVILTDSLKLDIKIGAIIKRFFSANVRVVYHGLLSAQSKFEAEYSSACKITLSRKKDNIKLFVLQKL